MRPRFNRNQTHDVALAAQQMLNTLSPAQISGILARVQGMQSRVPSDRPLDSRDWGQQPSQPLPRAGDDLPGEGGGDTEGEGGAGGPPPPSLNWADNTTLRDWVTQNLGPDVLGKIDEFYNARNNPNAPGALISSVARANGGHVGDFVQQMQALQNPPPTPDPGTAPVDDQGNVGNVGDDITPVGQPPIGPPSGDTGGGLDLTPVGQDDQGENEQGGGGGGGGDQGDQGFDWGDSQGDWWDSSWNDQNQPPQDSGDDNYGDHGDTGNDNGGNDDGGWSAE